MKEVEEMENPFMEESKDLLRLDARDIKQHLLFVKLKRWGRNNKRLCK